MPSWCYLGANLVILVFGYNLVHTKLIGKLDEPVTRDLGSQSGPHGYVSSFSIWVGTGPGWEPAPVLADFEAQNPRKTVGTPNAGTGNPVGISISKPRQTAGGDTLVQKFQNS